MWPYFRGLPWYGVGGYSILGILIFIGWILNLVDIFHSIAGPASTMLILRIIGVFLAPLGAILGWFF